jgi:hypothetical protein
MAGALGKAWAKGGHSVFYGSREPEKAAALAASNGANAQGGRLVEAAAFGEVILLASIWVGVAETLQVVGQLTGKVLIDCTLPLRDRQLDVNFSETSGAEEIARRAPGSRVVKAFHTVSFQQMDKPRIGSQAISLFYCGDDGGAKTIVAQLAGEMGFDPVDCGPLFIARLLEPMGVLWIFLAAGVGLGDDIGFKLLREDQPKRSG